MHPLAEELNRQIRENNPHLHEMLSPLGRRLFFPRGILSQSAEAKEKAFRFNATIGIALEKGEPMHLPCIRSWIPDLPPSDVFPYAPAAGKPALRERWREKQLAENPSLQGKHIGTPIVTSALTHGLSLVGDLFVREGDLILLPDKYWGNYRLIFEVRKGARLLLYPFYNASGGFDVRALRDCIRGEAPRADKLIVLLNFPNNPCGYSINPDEALAIAEVLTLEARRGTRLVVVLDEAYYGLFHTEGLMTESLLGLLANQDERLVAIKLDGATKEEFVWGLRVGFLTFGLGGHGNLSALYEALERKTMGAIRGSMSNSPHLSQTLVLKALESPDLRREQAEKFALIRSRARKVQEVLKNPKYGDAWNVYPFNAGYFMCIQVKGVQAEALRQHLLEHHGIGVIASGSHDVRIAFSCIEEEDIEELFDRIYRAVMELRSN